MHPYQSLVAWLSLSFSTATFASIPFPSTIQPSNANNTQCQIYPTTIESWNQLEVDQFLANFPGGKDTPLDDFIFGSHITNFACGLGENCLAGQQCLPFQGSLWFMLYSLQEWNLYVNSLYDATTAAVAQIKEISSSMITDFLISPDLHEKQATRLAILLTLVTGSAILAFAAGLFGPVCFPAWGVATEAELLEEEVGSDAIFQTTIKINHNKRSLSKRSLATDSRLPLDAVYESQKTLSSKLQGLGGNFGASSATGTPDLQKMKETLHYLTKKSIWSDLVVSVLSGNEKKFVEIKNNLVSGHETNEEQRLVKRSAPQDIPPDHFATWNVINAYLTSFCDHLKSVIAVTSQIGVTAPISSDEGVWGIIRGGKFLSPNPNMSQIQDKLRETMRLSALAQVLKSMNVFVTIGSDKCNNKGPNGAWKGDDKLSFCSPEGLMMNLIRASRDKSVNKIVNAHLITEKYGYTVEFLAQSAWSCQEHNLKIAGRPSPEGLKPDSKVGCTFDLPVCDTRIPEVAKLRKKHKSTVVACRRGLALNI
ncbi:hypothetical protein PGT21_032938 [Puccinia graminis f. sp. tritici]|uniref:DUF7872 domain-containing protein n=1 Tax=Puccinia graminis f. sp. tritici TaxID=56615 RepID=A0A5B0LZL9_PUCGR|nr:hypothetical protein PGT21_032938 [Puccinia graminis f. sp. tritici]